jgi:hypothetical protein
VPRSNPQQILIGQPIDQSIDVGTALYKGEDVVVNIFSGSSMLQPGQNTGLSAVVERVLSPLESNEVGTIRCVGLNVSTRKPVVIKG